MQIETTETLKAMIFPTILAIPTILVVLVGIGYSIFNFKHYPKVSLLTIIALVINGLLSIVNVLYPFLSILMYNSEMETQTISFIYSTINVVTTIIGTIALGLLVIAVWINRTSE